MAVLSPDWDCTYVHILQRDFKKRFDVSDISGVVLDRVLPVGVDLPVFKYFSKVSFPAFARKYSSFMDPSS